MKKTNKILSDKELLDCVGGDFILLQGLIAPITLLVGGSDTSVFQLGNNHSAATADGARSFSNNSSGGFAALLAMCGFAM